MSTPSFAIQPSESSDQEKAREAPVLQGLVGLLDEMRENEQATEVPVLQYAPPKAPAHQTLPGWILPLAFVIVAVIGCLIGAIWLSGTLPWSSSKQTEAQTQAIQKQHAVLQSIGDELETQSEMIETLQKSAQLTSETWQQEQQEKIGQLQEDVGSKLGLMQREWRGLQEALDADLKLRDHELGWVHYQLAMSYSDQQRYEEALIEFRKALDSVPDSPVFWNQLGYCYLALGNTTEAIQAFLKYVQFAPSDANAYDSLAEGYLQARQFKAAEDAYSRVIELSPSQTSAYYGLGRVYEQMGLPGLAAAQYEKMIVRFAGVSDRWVINARQRLTELGSNPSTDTSVIPISVPNQTD